MKFDTVIIGGGLAGLTAGISLAKKGLKTAIVSTGYSALHFSSGSMELLSYDEAHQAIDRPLEAIVSLQDPHPYGRLGAETIGTLLPEARGVLSEAGIEISGSDERPHHRLTPIGIVKPAWLMMKGYVTMEALDALAHRRVAIVNVAGFLDFFPRFIASALDRKGFKCSLHTVETDDLRTVRTSTSEMRAPNVARVLHGKTIETLARAINAAIAPSDADAVLFPAVVGYDSPEDADRLARLVEKPLYYVATVGASVPGLRAQMQLVRHFRRLGGTYLQGDSAVSAHYAGSRLEGLTTRNFSDDTIEAGSFVFAAGSFFSHGLKALPDGIVEPVLGLDVDSPSDRAEWFDKDMMAPQRYMKFGVAVDHSFRALRSGQPVDNVYVAGAALAGADSLREGSGAGIAMLTALNAAHNIIKNR